jgi:hypothetical protein
MPFYGTMALVYIGVGLLYGLLCVLHRKELIQVQFGVLGAFLFAILEAACWYFFYNGLNQTGYPAVAASVFAVAFSVAKKTYARTLLLLFSMGLGVAKFALSFYIISNTPSLLKLKLTHVHCAQADYRRDENESGRLRDTLFRV